MFCKDLSGSDHTRQPSNRTGMDSERTIRLVYRAARAHCSGVLEGVHHIPGSRSVWTWEERHLEGRMSGEARHK
jgi:hypothetical protein